jgi:predicted ABC-type ATPase
MNLTPEQSRALARLVRTLSDDDRRKLIQLVTDGVPWLEYPEEWRTWVDKFLVTQKSTLVKYSEDQERDENGRFSSGGGSAEGSVAGASLLTNGVTYAPNARAGYGDIAVTDKMLQDFQSAGGSVLDRFDPVTGQWTPEAQANHDAIIEKALEGVQDPFGQKTWNMIGGGPASGKSTLLESGQIEFPKEGEAVFINPDDVKNEIDGVAAMQAANDPTWAGWSHEESSYVAMRIQAAAQERGLSVVSDIVGDSTVEKMESKIDSFADQGYKIQGTYLFCDIDTAVDRAVSRGITTGRVVPESVIRGSHEGVASVVPALIDGGKFDRLTLFENTNNPVKMGETNDDGDFVVLDQGLYDLRLGGGSK